MEHWTGADQDRGCPAERVLALPEGKRLLLCVGAQKAGTTWLAENLARHPECHFFPHEKELHYFDTRYRGMDGMRWFRLRSVQTLFEELGKTRGEDYTRLTRELRGQLDLLDIYRDGPLGTQAWLAALGNDAGAARWLCDFTPDYSPCPPCAYAEMASFGAAEGRGPRFIFLMRDPVDRHWSFLRMLLEHRGVPADEAPVRLRDWLEHDIVNGPISTRGQSDYAGTIAKLEAHAPADDILLMFYEDLFRQDSYDRICDFLGIPRRAADFRVVHEGAAKHPIPDDLAGPFRESLEAVYAFAFDRFGDAVPERWRRFG